MQFVMLAAGIISWLAINPAAKNNQGFECL